MRDLLQRIRTRVDRLAADAVVRTCDGQHAVMHVSFVPSGDPVPDWPPTDAPTRCGCGAALDYRHIIHLHVREERTAEG